ncbi:MAG: hypothetical protein ACI8RH_001399 [Flavobacteriales bacterium]|jgi:hypothetical protein
MKSFKTVVLLFTFSLLLASCDSYQSSNRSAIDFIASSTELIYAIDDISQIEKDLKDNVLLDVMSASTLQRTLKKHPFINKLPFTSEVLIAVPSPKDTTNNVLIIAKINTTNLQDSLPKLSSPQKGIVKKNYGNQEVYQAHVGDFILVSPVKQHIEKTIQLEKSKDKALTKLLASNTHKGISIYTKNNTYLDGTSIFSSWNGLDITLVSKGIQGSGIAMIQDSLQLLSVFKGQQPHAFTMAAMIPSDANRGVILGYSNAALLYQNINAIKKDSTAALLPEVFETVKTIGQIALDNGTITLLESLDSQLTLESLSAYISEKETFRDIVLYQCNRPYFVEKTFSPLLQAHEINVLFSLDNYIVGASSQAIAEQYITAIKTRNILSETSYFKTASDQLPTNASLLVFEQEHTAGFSNQVLGDTLSEKKANAFPIAILQYKYDGSFAHINFICHKAGKEVKKAQGVSQLITIDVAKTILGTPQFFTNHKTDEKEVVVQDIENKLHLYALNGTKLWTRSLEQPILGDLQEIDLLRNGKKQLAFTSKNKFHVIDRNGKDVAPFPITFRDEITQPLAVFDYDNTRKYRFVIIQGKEVIMLDSNGKTVKGFTFKKAKSTIIAMPQHIRLQNKDYLLFQQENGTLSILSRTGKQRVTVSEKINLTGAPILKTRTSFVLVTKEREEKTISQTGKITSKKLNTTNDYYLDVVRNNTVSLSDNQLRINGKHIELPFGIYTKPEVYYANKKGYISTTETQEKKSYLYSFKGQLYRGFPVYGASSTRVVATKKNVFMITKEDATKILVYRIN